MVELLLIIHFLVILFIIFGFPVGLVVNCRLFRIIHFATLAGVSLLMVLEIPCPLTIWEEMLRQSPIYEGSFISSWLNRIIYLEDFDASIMPYLTVGFLALTVSSFFWHPTTRRGAK
ncbi:MAG: DUF2784 domain-containing protein [Nitrospinae bacterium]|nr:DUF2784 domain-containing protein [Nitrospinota bacterium]MBL7020390.1 DUF2784 domain-containing protein [Nitrospinaceae bacterium]